MSKVENVNFCYICDLAFETRKLFIIHRLSDEHLNRARKENEDEVEDPQSGFTDESRERVYNSDEDDYVLRPKDNTKDIIKTKTETKTKGDDTIYTRILILSTPIFDQIKITLNIIIVIDVYIGLIHKLNTTNMNAATLSNPRLFVLRRRKLLL